MNCSKLAVLLVTASGLALIAQDAEKFEGWMKSVNSSAGALRKMEKKTGPEAAEHAEKIAAVYENMIDYWRQAKADDGVKLSEAGKAAAAELATAAKGGDDAAAMTAFAKVGSTCKPCHEAHREKTADGKYKIK